MARIPFDKDLRLVPGEADEPVPGIRRVMADNPGPFTFKGTISYIVGHGKVAIIDPGPLDTRHIEALLSAVRGETVTHIFVTHTHNDHSPAVAAIKAATGATVYAEGGHRPARPVQDGDLTRPADRDFRPDVVLRDGETVTGEGWRLQAIATPGHTANHMAFALGGTDILFSGDHVMGWSSTIVAPPDGSMYDYMASLKKLIRRNETVYFPGHGPAIRDASQYGSMLLEHRKQREQAVLNRLEDGASTVAAIVDRGYQQLDERLIPAARMTVWAHIEDLVRRGIVLADGLPTLTATYRLAGT